MMVPGLRSARKPAELCNKALLCVYVPLLLAPYLSLQVSSADDKPPVCQILGATRNVAIIRGQCLQLSLFLQHCHFQNFETLQIETLTQSGSLFVNQRTKLFLSHYYSYQYLSRYSKSVFVSYVSLFACLY